MIRTGEFGAIQVYYKGYHFRSKTEARWQVFFDALGIRSEYEPQGYILPIGKGYLPDFWLRDLGYWVEIKSDFEFDREEAELKAYLLTTYTKCPLVLIQGAPGYDLDAYGNARQSFTMDIFAGNSAHTWTVPNMVNAELDYLCSLDPQAFYSSRRDMSLLSERIAHLGELMQGAHMTIGRRVYREYALDQDGKKLVFKMNMHAPLSYDLIYAIDIVRAERFGT